MAERLTLDDAWELTLTQERYVIQHLKSGKSVMGLRREWLEEHGIDTGRESPRHYCFFCEYDKRNGDEWKETRNGFAWQGECSSCPGKLVSRRFDCHNKTYNFEVKPFEFYQKLLELNKKRLEREIMDVLGKLKSE